MIISIGGDAGSGKSTVAKLLAEKLGLKHFSAGDLQRELANDLGISITDLGELEKKDDKYDKMVDEKQSSLAKLLKSFVIDGWLSAHFIPSAIKIFLRVDIEEAVKRRLKQSRDEEEYKDAEEAKKIMAQRSKTNRERWYKYYGFDYLDMKNYDFVIDTTNLDVEGVVGKILKKVKT
ncbi:AAA family ATPase [Candidatus Woesearchaeota archaeon]|nr:AAA family ATPase [Candidatus Woesearchaeota archaeon]